MIANDFLSIRDFSPQQIEHVLDVACHVKADPAAYSTALKGKTLAMIFEKPSPDARVTFEVGIHQLGGFALCLSPAEIQLGKSESIYDVAKHLERVVQAIMISTFAHEIVEEMADSADIPVINGLTDYSDPCQAMADYLTMLELKGRVKGLKVAFVGAGNNVAHSLMFAGAQVGAQITVATPAGYEPCQAAARWARLRARETGGSCTVVVDPFEAVVGADVVYTDAWTGMGPEVESQARGQAFAVPGERGADVARQAGGDLHAQPAGAPRTGGYGRGDRFAAVGGFSAGGKSFACAEGDHDRADEGRRSGA